MLAQNRIISSIRHALYFTFKLLHHPFVIVGVGVTVHTAVEGDPGFLRFLYDMECGEGKEPDGMKILRVVEWFQVEGVTETAL